MSLAFLAKKSWHTANINNQERVWLAEQEKEREKKKTELLRKQMMEEREMEELRKMQGREGGQERLSWMYAPVSVTQTDADEYLMGKPKEEDKGDEELKKVLHSIDTMNGTARFDDEPYAPRWSRMKLSARPLSKSRRTRQRHIATI